VNLSTDLCLSVMCAGLLGLWCTIIILAVFSALQVFSKLAPPKRAPLSEPRHTRWFFIRWLRGVKNSM